MSEKIPISGDENEPGGPGKKADANGLALQRMRDAGDDLTKSRLVEFAHTMPSEETAQKLLFLLGALGYDADSYARDGSGEWVVTCGLRMIPNHDAISATEKRLGAMAAELGGHRDGWGCFEV